jgi:hypothetical protein
MMSGLCCCLQIYALGEYLPVIVAAAVGASPSLKQKRVLVEHPLVVAAAAVGAGPSLKQKHVLVEHHHGLDEDVLGEVERHAPPYPLYRPSRCFRRCSG